MSTYIKPPESHACQWQTGFPAEPGWYPASFKFPPDPGVLRYYFGDGKWSVAYEHTTSADWFELAGPPLPLHEPRDDIMWSVPWWHEPVDEPVDEQEGDDAQAP